MAIPSPNSPSAIPSPPASSPLPDFTARASTPHGRTSSFDSTFKQENDVPPRTRKELKELKEAKKHLERELRLKNHQNGILRQRLLWFQEWHRVEREKEREARSLFRADSKPYYNALAPDELLVKEEWFDEGTKPLTTDGVVKSTSSPSSTLKSLATALVYAGLRSDTAGELVKLGDELVHVPRPPWLVKDLIFWLVPISSIFLFYYSWKTDYVLKKWSILSVLGALLLANIMTLGHKIETATRGYHLVRFILFHVLFVRILWPAYIAGNKNPDWTDPNDSTRGYIFWGYYQYLYLLYIQVFVLVVAKSALLSIHIRGLSSAYWTRDFRDCVMDFQLPSIWGRWAAVYCDGVKHASWLHSEGGLIRLGHQLWIYNKYLVLSTPSSVVGWSWLVLVGLGILDLTYNTLLVGTVKLFSWAPRITLSTSPAMPRFHSLRKVVQHIITFISIIYNYTNIFSQYMKATILFAISMVLACTWYPVVNFISRLRGLLAYNIRRLANHIFRTLNGIPYHYWAYLYVYTVAAACLASYIVGGLSREVLILLTICFVAMVLFVYVREF